MQVQSGKSKLAQYNLIAGALNAIRKGDIKSEDIAAYYLALNELNLGQFDKAWSIMKTLEPSFRLSGNPRWLGVV